jgi:hypothetical protein
MPNVGRLVVLASKLNGLTFLSFFLYSLINAFGGNSLRKSHMFFLTGNKFHYSFVVQSSATKD